MYITQKGSSVYYTNSLYILKVWLILADLHSQYITIKWTEIANDMAEAWVSFQSQ